MRQPWLSETTDHRADDDFSRESATLTSRRAAGMLAIAVIVLFIGTAREFANLLLDLPILPGTDFAIEAMHQIAGTLEQLGITMPHEKLRALARAAEAARFRQ